MQDLVAHRVWDTALGQLQLQVTRPNYDTWLKDTVGLTANNGSFVIGTPSDFVSEWLSAKMGPVIAKTVGGILGQEVNLRFQVVQLGKDNGGHQADPPPLAVGSGPATAASVPATPKHLNAKFTFDRFVIGESNRLAAAAALAASKQPGDTYNPLFIYGGPGLGKTHLLQAIANSSENGDRRVIYITCEQFTNDFVSAISQGHQDEFRRKYRTAHVLLVDDVQFLAGKERTQEEFFHTYNDLYSDGCQVVLTSDRPPKTIAGLEARLSSRFQSGLIADIQPPDEETRLAILREKALEQRIDIDPEVAQLLADRAQDNVRELEGFLNRVTAYASLTRSPITLEMASLAIDALTPPTSPCPPSPDAIISGVAHYFNIPTTALQGPSRARPIAEARHVVMYLLREDAQLPLKQIGHLLGGRDHSTVIHGCRKVSTLIKTAKGRRQITEVQAHLRSSR
ncbi:MAG: chromosomal replication initiator protein DnaA [Chloroflexi bacterium]|nr:chromosomal replication initiator protein DnaA [Chloroflexota bacterium]